MVPTETKRLAFREWTVADLAAFHAICSDPLVMQHVGDGRPWSMAHAEQFIARAIGMSEEFGFCQWALIDKEFSQLIGYCGFVDSADGIEIGWRLAQSYWGQGLATEAARRALQHGFDSLGFTRVVATVQAANQASIRIAEKLGMKSVNRFRRGEREMLVFAIEAEQL